MKNKTITNKLISVILIITLLIGLTTLPASAAGEPFVVMVVAGTGHSLALLSDGKIKGWGNNYNGQLGIGNATNQSSPVTLPTITNAKVIVTNNAATFAILNDNTVKSWGFNGDGQLGLGDTTKRYSPVTIPLLSNVKEIVAGGYHTFAILNDGTVKSWGGNTSGQLGIGDNTRQTTPVTVPGLTNVKKIVSGSSYALALLNDGTVKAWGQNSYGQLGIGNTTHSLTPVTVPGLTNVKDIAVGGDYSFAILNDGTVKAWGHNGYGQLGIGTIADKLSPVIVPGLTNVKELAAGWNQSFALLSDGTVKSWGMNTYGQLGLGNKINQSSPVTVSGLTNVKEIVSGESHAFVILNNGTVKAWGKNTYGQLGDGTIVDKTSPVSLAAFQVIVDYIAKATEAVIAAELDKTQASVDTARLIVNALSDSSEKTNLTNRLDLVQAQIDGGSNSAEAIAEATVSVESAETLKTQASVDSALALVNELADGDVKTSLLNRLNVVQKNITDAAALQVATTAVENAEATKSQTDVNSARTLVNALVNSPEKTALVNRLNAVQAEIDAVLVQVQALADATAAVENAESLKTQASVDSARTLVSALPNSIEKTSLTSRLDVVQSIISQELAKQEAVTDAIDAIEQAELTKSATDVNAAKDLINALDEGAEKDALSTRLENLEAAIANETSAVQAVEAAESNPTQANVDAAKVLVDALTDESLKSSLTTRVEAAQDEVDYQNQVAAVEEAINNMQSTTETQVIQDLIDSLRPEDKPALETQLQEKEQVLAGSELTPEEQAALLQQIKDTTVKTQIADILNREPYLSNAQTAIDSLPSGEAKDILQDKLDAAGSSKAPSTATQIKQAQRFTQLAEILKREPYVQRALDKINALGDDTIKQEMVDKVQEVIKPVNAEETKAVKAVETAEQYKLPTLIRTATTVVNKLTNDALKTQLLTRLAAIK